MSIAASTESSTDVFPLTDTGNAERFAERFGHLALLSPVG